VPLADRFVSVLGFVGLLLSSLRAWRLGEDDPAAGVLTVAVVSLALVVADAAAWVAMERAPRGLSVAPGGPGLPWPAWWAPVGAAGLLAALVGLLTGAIWLVVLGGLVTLAGAAGLGRASRTKNAVSRRAVRAARSLLRLVGDQADSATAEVLPMGRDQRRLVVTRPDAPVVDLVLPEARQVAMLAGLSVRPA